MGKQLPLLHVLLHRQLLEVNRESRASTSAAFEDQGIVLSSFGLAPRRDRSGPQTTAGDNTAAAQQPPSVRCWRRY